MRVCGRFGEFFDFMPVRRAVLVVHTLGSGALKGGAGKCGAYDYLVEFHDRSLLKKDSPCSCVV